MVDKNSGNHLNENVSDGAAFIGNNLAAISFIAGILFSIYANRFTLIKYKWWIIGCMATVIIGRIFLLLIVRKKLPSVPEFVYARMPLPLSFILILCTFFASANGFYQAYVYSQWSSYSNVYSLAWISIITLALGTILFFIRSKWRCIYGISEVVVGVIVASQRFYSDALVTSAHTTTSGVMLTILTAGVYLVVRGADNIHQGIVKDVDPFGQFLLKLLGRIGASAAAHDYMERMRQTKFKPRKTNNVADHINDLN